MQAEDDFAGGQLQGNRADQEDCFAFGEQADGSLLIVVADGVGGHAAGHIASKTAVFAFLDAFERTQGRETARLSAALTLANQKVAATINDDPCCLSGMGTTLVAAHINGRSLRWISVGDSILYLIRGGQLTRLNADHSAAGLPPGYKLPRNILLSALTGERIPLIDAPRERLALEPGDILLAASDGLLTLPEEEIIALCAEASRKPAGATVEKLLAAVTAKARRSQDNATVALMKIG